MTPKCEINKSNQKGSKSLTPKTLLCSSAEDQNSQNQGKPCGGEAPARKKQTTAQVLSDLMQEGMGAGPACRPIWF